MKHVAIAKLADTEGVVRDRTFEDCEIIGPVSLVLLGTENEIVDCGVQFSIDTASNYHLGTGPVVFLANCTLRRCRFATDIDATGLESAQAWVK